MPLSRTARVVATAFTVSGVVHLVRPQTFRPVMPPYVPAQHQVIVWSGVAELVCAAGLASPRTRRPAALASAVLLVAVLPGNVHMATEALRGGSTPAKAVTLARLPLQWPMVRAMWRTWREA